MGQNIHVIGVGMVPFAHPGGDASGDALGAQAAKAALADAGLGYGEVGQVFAASVGGGSCSGQAAAYRLGLSGVPVVNVGNSCASGGTALFLSRQAILAGGVDCALVIGFDQVPRQAPQQPAEEAGPALARLIGTMRAVQGIEPQVPLSAQLFGGAGRMHRQLYGTSREAFARIAVKARGHAAKNPYALYREMFSLDDVLAAPMVFDPLTAWQCAAPASGAAAAVLCSAAYARRRGLSKQILIAGQAMTTDGNSSFDEKDMRKLAGYDMTRRAARQAYDSACLGPEDLQVVELHDSFTAAELLAYEALGLVAEGGAEGFIASGFTSGGGHCVVNPSGGVLGRGDAGGATGVAQCAELVWQLRSEAGERQVTGARVGLQHNLGLGGACVVTIYQRR